MRHAHRNQIKYQPVHVAALLLCGAWWCFSRFLNDTATALATAIPALSPSKLNIVVMTFYVILTLTGTHR
jgi:hypothetical protein